MFCSKTVTSPRPGISRMYCVLAPANDTSTIRPGPSTFSSPSRAGSSLSSRSFSGRTPTVIAPEVTTARSCGRATTPPAVRAVIRPPEVDSTLGREEVGLAQEARDEAGARQLVELLRRAELLDAAVVHDGHGVGHRHGLLLVVRDVQEGQTHLGLDRLELELHLTAQLEVERAERLVQQQERRAVHDRPGQRHALLLTAGQLTRAPVGDVVEFDERGAPRGPWLTASGTLRRFRPNATFSITAHVREERVALEHRVDRPLVRLDRGHVLPADQDAAGGRVLEPGDQAQGRRLAASRGAEQGEERSRGDQQVELLDRGEPGEGLADPLELQICAGLGEFSRGHRQAPRPTASNSELYFCCSSFVRVRKMCAWASVSSLGKMSWFSTRSGSISAIASCAPATGVM